MKFTPQIIEIFKGIDLSSSESVLQAYEEGYNNALYLSSVIQDPDNHLCDNEGNFEMEEANTALKRDISTFVNCRRQRLWELVAKAICDSIPPYIILEKVMLCGEFYTNQAFKEAAIALGFVEEPKNKEERDNSVMAMCKVGALAMDIIEKYSLSVIIYSNHLNKEQKEGVEGLPNEKELENLINESYAIEEVDSFEKAVLTTFEEAIYAFTAAIMEGISDTSTNDYLFKGEAAASSIRNASEFLTLTALQRIAEAEEKGEPHPYTEEQAAYVLNYVELKYPQEQC